MTLDEALSRAPLRPFHWAIFAMCMLVLVCDGVDLQLLGLVAPVVIADWGVDRASFGLAMGTALVGMAVGAWAGGLLGDRFGRRAVLGAAALLFGAATLAASQADTIPTMAALRLLGGLGFGAAFPNAMALVSEWLPERWRAYAITAMSVSTPIGGSAAAALAPALLAQVGWRGAFAVFGGITLVLAIAAVAILRDSPTFLLAKGKSDQAYRHARRVVSEVTIPPTAPVEVAPAARHGSVGIFHPSNRRLNIGIAIGFAASTLIIFAIIGWATTMLTAAGFTLPQALRASLGGGIASIVGALLAGPLVRRFGSRRVMAIVSIVAVGVIVALAGLVGALPPVPGAEEQLAASLLLAGITGVVSVGIATIYVMMTFGYAQACRASGIGFGMLMGRTGGIASSFGGGYLLDVGGGSTLPFFIALGIAAALISATALVVDRHVPAPIRA